MTGLLTLLLAICLSSPLLIVLLRSYEYEGDDQMVGLTGMVLHGSFAAIMCLAWVIVIMTVLL